MQRGGRVFPCIFVLLPNKTKVTYRRLMVVISKLTYGRSPTGILVGFERGTINPIQANYASANVKGCFFHLCSNVFKHVQNKGLQVRYVEKSELVFQLRMLTALAFLSPQDAVRGFVAI